MNEISVDDLLHMIGSKDVEIYHLRRQLAALQAEQANRKEPKQETKSKA